MPFIEREIVPILVSVKCAPTTDHRPPTTKPLIYLSLLTKGVTYFFYETKNGKAEADTEK